MVLCEHQPQRLLLFCRCTHNNHDNHHDDHHPCAHYDNNNNNSCNDYYPHYFHYDNHARCYDYYDNDHPSNHHDHYNIKHFNNPLFNHDFYQRNYLYRRCNNTYFDSNSLHDHDRCYHLHHHHTGRFDDYAFRYNHHLWIIYDHIVDPCLRFDDNLSGINDLPGFLHHPRGRGSDIYYPRHEPDHNTASYHLNGSVGFFDPACDHYYAARSSHYPPRFDICSIHGSCGIEFRGLASAADERGRFVNIDYFLHPAAKKPNGIHELLDHFAGNGI